MGFTDDFKTHFLPRNVFSKPLADLFLVFYDEKSMHLNSMMELRLPGEPKIITVITCECLSRSKPKLSRIVLADESVGESDGVVKQGLASAASLTIAKPPDIAPRQSVDESTAIP